MTDSVARADAVGQLLTARLAGFAELLRQRGMTVGAHDLMDAMQVLDTLDLGEQDSLYWALRLTMVRSHHQLEVFDPAFREYWHRRTGEERRRRVPADRPDAPQRPGGESDEGAEREERRSTAGLIVGRPPGQEGPEGDDEGDAERRAVYSELEVLGSKNFADYTPSDHAKLVEMLTLLQTSGPWRLSRRKRPNRRGAIDIRRTVRASFRTEGYPMRQRRQRPQLKQRRLTFVCDVSGSMQSYSRPVLELAHVALVGRRRVEAFAFATRLTRLTRQLLERDPVAAIERAVAAVVDWSGGTRVGDCLAQLIREERAALQGAVVVIASDGWDMGDAARLSDAAELLHRLAHRVIWVNPQLQDPAFEPLTRGMSAALPHVDDFIACHNFASFTQLIALLDEA